MLIHTFMRAQRLLSILLQLQVNRRVTARELASKLEVSERTILRDMDALSISGVPVVAERGAGGGWSLLEEYQTRLTGLSPEEVQSLFVARPARVMADLGLKQAADMAWTKLAGCTSPWCPATSWLCPAARSHRHARMAESIGAGREPAGVAGCVIPRSTGPLRV